MEFIQNIVNFGLPKVKIILSYNDEIVLRNVLNDIDRWTRITPSGQKKYEPLLEILERESSMYCIVKPGPYVGKVTLQDSELLFMPPKWLEGLEIAHIIYMLIKSHPGNTKTTYLPEFISENHTNISELNEPLYFLYVTELLSALKKGRYRSYEQQNLISSKFRGQLDFPKQIMLNMNAKALFATKQQVFSEVNDVNRLLSSATQIIIEKSTIFKTIETAQQAKRLLPLLTLNKKLNINKIVLERRGHHLNTSFDIAKLILSGHSISYEGEISNTFSMVINLFDLFEKYIVSELFTRDKHYNGQYKLPLTDVKSTSSWSSRSVYPDIVYESNKNKLVIDIKLKNITASGPKIEDIYQIYFYSTMLNMNKGYIIYPTNSKTPIINSFPIEHAGNRKLDLVAYGLPIVKSIAEMSTEIDTLHEYLFRDI